MYFFMNIQDRTQWTTMWTTRNEPNGSTHDNRRFEPYKSASDAILSRDPRTNNSFSRRTYSFVLVESDGSAAGSERT